MCTVRQTPTSLLALLRTSLGERSLVNPRSIVARMSCWRSPNLRGAEGVGVAAGARCFPIISGSIKYLSGGTKPLSITFATASAATSTACSATAASCLAAASAADPALALDEM